MRTVDTREYLDMVCGLLAEGKTRIPVPVAGTSMTPFLHPGDTVYLDLPGETLKPGDVVLYRRGGQYVLHRIHSRRTGGGFFIVGDSQLALEPVEKTQICAKMTAANCGRMLTPKDLRWRFFATLWRRLPLRRIAMALHSKLKTRTR